MSPARRFLIAALALMPAGALLAKRTDRSKSTVKRCHAVTGLRQEKVDYYVKLHAATWPGVLKMIERANIRNYSIAMKEIEGKLYLFSYFEYIGQDYEEDMKRIASDPETQRWWRETAPCQIPLRDAPQGSSWSDAKEVFYTAGASTESTA